MSDIDVVRQDEARADFGSVVHMEEILVFDRNLNAFGYVNTRFFFVGWQMLEGSKRTSLGRFGQVINKD